MLTRLFPTRRHLFGQLLAGALLAAPFAVAGTSSDVGSSFDISIGGPGDRYIAFEPNNHASATITGPIIAKNGQVRLENGRVMSLTYLGLPPIADWPSVRGDPLNSYVFEVSGSFGEMRWGKDLCKGGDPKYAVARVTASQRFLYYDIALYRGDSPPESAWDEDLCAEVYSYRAERAEVARLSAMKRQETDPEEVSAPAH